MEFVRVHGEINGVLELFRQLLLECVHVFLIAFAGVKTIVDAFRLLFRNDRAYPRAGNRILRAAAHDDPEIFSGVLVRQGVGFRVLALLHQHGLSGPGIRFFPLDDRAGGFVLRSAVAALQRGSDHFLPVNVGSEPRSYGRSPGRSEEHPPKCGQKTEGMVFEFKHGGKIKGGTVGKTG